ncbi:MAG TPA: flavodoxin family protein, partial [Acidimicrobiia bacterium]|nr:flavodoxin family protein [Acidimicrobiia bacterium]
MPTGTGTTHAMVVYESMFGNTRAVAEAIADSLARHFDRVDVLEADVAPLTLDGVSLVVVGAPTHAFGMSRPSTR